MVAAGFNQGGEVHLGTFAGIDIGASVPEPATWAMMLTGFFGAGSPDPAHPPPDAFSRRLRSRTSTRLPAGAFRPSLTTGDGPWVDSGVWDS